jgi:hypothetical protein
MMDVLIAVVAEHREQVFKWIHLVPDSATRIATYRQALCNHRLRGPIKYIWRFIY